MHPNTTGLRVTLVTGAGKGLGAAFARAAAARGDAVVVNARPRPGEPCPATSLAAELTAAGGLAHPAAVDVADSGAAEWLVEQALSRFGALDAVIANAGISGPAAKTADADLASFRRLMDVNFHANVALAQASLGPLQRSGTGRLLFVSSSAGLHGVRGRAPYAASKAALNAFALSLAEETRRTGLGVNVLAPYARTAMTEGVAFDPALAALLAPESVAPLALWLTSPDCAISGEIWVAGANWFRRARMIEGEGAGWLGEGPATQDWLAATLPRLEAMEGARSFAHAEAAFTDLAELALAQVREAS